METKMETPSKAATEPSVLVASLLSLIGVTFVLLRAFFPDLIQPSQEDAISGFLTVALPLAVGFILRNKVTPNANVLERLSSSGFVVAGEANELVATGDRIRILAEPDEPGPEPRRALVEPEEDFPI